MIAIRGLQKSFGSTRVLRGIDLDIADGEVVALIGRSGCGKTTLLRCIAGLTDLTGGELKVGGKPVVGPPDGVAMVFQHFGLLPWKTVHDNAAFGLAMAHAPAARIKERVAERRWEPTGGMWLESDCNVTGGESFVRHLLYGQRYFERTFGRRHSVAWLPDVFGFSGAMIGGLSNPRGCVIGGFVLGVFESLVNLWQAQWREVAVFGLVILVLAFRPTGLFGKKLVEKV